MAPAEPMLRTPHSVSPSAYLILVPTVIALVLMIVNFAGDYRQHWWLVPVNGVFWVWACINVYTTKSFDLGVLTFLVGLVSGIIEIHEHHATLTSTRAALAGAVLVLFNFCIAVPIAVFKGEDLAATKGKPKGWVRVFLIYLIFSVVVWIVAVGFLASDLADMA